jgi:acetyl esterase/lipase
MQLILRPRAAAYNPQKAFRKLNIGSLRDLAAGLLDRPSQASRGRSRGKPNTPGRHQRSDQSLSDDDRTASSDDNEASHRLTKEKLPMSVPANNVVLEPAVQVLADATSKPPYVYELSYAEARKVLNDLQSGPIEKLPIDEEWITVPSPFGDARVRIIKPIDAKDNLPAIVYMHGGGWVLGNAGTHDRLVRELAVGSHAALAFVEYPNSPEARYPVAIEHGYATAQWITRHGASKGLDPTRIAVAGESVGGDMTAALTLMAKERGDLAFVHAGIYYPVTDAAMDTASYNEFADGPWLTRKAMEWFWDAYIADPSKRSEITASPNQATIEQLKGLPPTLLLVDEADVLRDEGEAYAAKLRLAGVPITTVRYDGTCHDFMLLNALTHTRATRAAIAQATEFLRQALGTD